MLYENVISNNLNALIKERGINARKLSLASGVSQPRISDILRGRTKNPQILTMARLAKSLDVTIDELITPVG